MSTSNVASKALQHTAAAATSNDEVEHFNKRLNKIYDTRLDTDKEALEALADVSTFFTENTLQTRRNLRSQIERRSLAINANFLAAFSDVKESFDSVCSDIASMTASINGMQQSLLATQSQTQELIQQTNALQATGTQLQLHQQVAGAFLQRFQLTVAEHQQLYGTTTTATIAAAAAAAGTTSSSSPAPITNAFFDALSRVQAVHADCRVLLQSGYQTVALDIMEEMTLHQEAALERLYRWTQNHCRNVVAASADGGDGIGALVVTAMNRLQDRPVLFKYVVDEYATARRAVLVRSFIDALTIGGTTKPIEMHAHDTKRYIGDMFAWIHQAVPLEKENLLTLLRDCDRADCSALVQQALANISDGLCAPLKVRVETVLNAERDLIVLYAVANLMRFYQNIVAAVVRGGQLDECLGALQTFGEEAYLGVLGVQVRTLLQQQQQQQSGGKLSGLEPPHSDLRPPEGVSRLLNVLKEILSVASMVESRQNDITKIVSCVVDPLLHAVTESASHMPTVDMAVYLLNCLYQMQSTLTMYEYVDERLERLQGHSDAQLDTLTSEQASSLVANLNLGPIYTLLQQRSSGATNAPAVIMEPTHMRRFCEKFEAFLDVPEMLLLPQVNLLQSNTHRATVQRRSFSVIVAIYRQLYERVQQSQQQPSDENAAQDGNGDENGASPKPRQLEQNVFKRTPDEVEELLAG